MKLLFSLLFINLAWSRPIAVISYWAHADLASHVRELIIDGGYLPPSLIKIKKQFPACAKEPDSIIHLCITNQREMKTVKIDKEIVLKSLKVFNGK